MVPPFSTVRAVNSWWYRALVRSWLSFDLEDTFLPRKLSWGCCVPRNVAIHWNRCWQHWLEVPRVGECNAMGNCEVLQKQHNGFLSCPSKPNWHLWNIPENIKWVQAGCTSRYIWKVLKKEKKDSRRFYLTFHLHTENNFGSLVTSFREI